MKEPQIQVRRRPRQSRAKFTQQALQESFVRLLSQHTAERITIREITNLAGVGLGTFYEYFSRKEDLLALAIHSHVKQNATQLLDYAQRHAGTAPAHLLDQVTHLIQYQLQLIQREQFLWAQIFLLERQISSIDSYRKSYSMMEQMWRQLIRAYVEHDAVAAIALNIQRICYGFVSQTLLINPQFQDWPYLEQDILQALSGVIQPNSSV